MKPKYEQAPMVRWFDIKILAQSGMKALISSLFGNYADRREMQAALDLEMKEDGQTLCINNLEYNYAGDGYTTVDELWFDLVSDTGDGFNSTYSVATTVAQPFITIKTASGEQQLPRGKLLLLGGDQIYPTPTNKLYENKFKIPFAAAFPESETIPASHMYAIPGNHDWYDGLGSFLKVFCQQRWIGNWQTQQRRSYFALQLPHRYWVWGIDIQLSGDIDQPQMKYFAKVAEDMQQSDKVILLTAKPAWVYKQMFVDDESFETLSFFIQSFITGERYGWIDKKFELVVLLTGDLHHYTHYATTDQDGNIKKDGVRYITAGGGGAYLTLTHDMPKRLQKVEEERRKSTPKNVSNKEDKTDKILLQKTYPDATVSKKLLLGNLLFLKNNFRFTAIFGFFFAWVLWILASYTLMAGKPYLNWIKNADFETFACETFDALAISPTSIALCVVMIIAFIVFADKKRDGKCAPKIYGGFFGLLVCCAMFVTFWGIATFFFPNKGPQDTAWFLLAYLIAFAAGMIIGGILMGIYLYTTNVIFHNQVENTSNSLSNQDYKNFLRMHLDETGLTIYPIGIDRVTKNWQTHEEDDKDISFTGPLPEVRLIEEPIFIPR